MRSRRCSSAECAYVNVHTARYCARCGRQLSGGAGRSYVRPIVLALCFLVLLILLLVERTPTLRPRETSARPMPHNTPAPVDPRDTHDLGRERRERAQVTVFERQKASEFAQRWLDDLERAGKERAQLTGMERPKASGFPTRQSLQDLSRELGENIKRGTTILRLRGISMRVPYGASWQSVSLPKRHLKRNLALVALFRLPKVDRDVYDCEVRVTHDPTNPQQSRAYVLREWQRQVRNADGTMIRGMPARVVERPSAGGTLCFVVTDLFGTVTTVSDGSSVTRPNHRFTGVILEHAHGPHLVTAVGPAASMARWEESIFEFVQSAKLTWVGVPAP